MESFECQGLWWLPSDSKNKVPGILKFDPTKGSKLRLLGSLKVRDARLTLCNDLIPYTDIILGETSSQVFTLYKCHENESGIKESGFNIDFIFKGHHFCRLENIIFDCVTIKFPNLEKWVNVSAIRRLTANLDKISEDKPKDYFHFIKHEDIEAKLDGFNIIISFNQIPIPKIPNELDLVQFPYIKLKFNNKTHFNIFKAKWNILSDFLTFGIGKAVYPSSIMFQNDFDSNIELFYNINSIIPHIDDVSQNDMIFWFSDISNIFEKCLNNWFNNAEKFGPVYDLYFGTHRRTVMFGEHRFLSFIQAIEAYHSRKCPEKSKKRRIWTLRRRLESIFIENGDLLEILINDIDKFIDDVVNTRNYYTHYDRDKEKKAITETNQFIILTYKLRFVLEICLFLELGLDEEMIRKIISRNREYNFLRDRIRNQISKSCGVPTFHLIFEKLMRG